MWYRKTLTYDEQLDELEHLLSFHVESVPDPPEQAEEVPEPTKYKYNEGQILFDIQQYINSTYGQHYVGQNGVQVNDLIIALGHAEGSYVSNAIEYLARYGKKDGKNKKDLLKAIHNIMLLISNDFYDGEKRL